MQFFTRVLSLCCLIQVARTASIACDLSRSADEYCENFCSGKCSFFNVTAGETGEPQNLTLYRITPTNVTDVVNKNTADAAGDIDFIISKKNLTQTCLHDPTAMGCGTDREDKDMYAQFVVEIDGKFGPYSMCNPANGYDTGNFFCGIDCFEPTEKGCGHKYPQVNGTGWSGGPECFCDRTALAVGREMAPSFSSHDMDAYPKQCAGGFTPIKESCITAERIYKNLSAWSFESLSSIACQTCYVDQECTGWISYDNLTAHLLAGHVSNTTAQKCVGAVRYKSPWSSGGQWFGIANLGGCTKDSGCQNVWYSTRREGECLNGAPLGTNGCTWRLLETRKYVNATCVDLKADLAVEMHGKTCFDKCPQPLDRNTDCYLDCYRNTLMGDAYQNITAIEPEKMIKPWKRAFEQDDPSKGGCPPIRPKNNIY